MTILLLITAMGHFVAGLCASVLGSVKLPLARQLSMDEGRVGGLVAAFGITFLPVVIISGWLIDHFGAQLVFTTSIAGSAVGLLCLAMANSFRGAVLATILYSAHWSALINVAHVLIPMAFPWSITTGTNLADLCFSIGALTTPLIAAAFLRRDKFRGLLLLIATFAALATIPCFFVAFDGGVPLQEDESVGAAALGIADLLASPMVWLCGLCLFTFGPVETTFAVWTSSYLVEKGYDAAFGTRMISAFWGASLLSRLVTALFLPVGQEAALVMLLAVATTIITAGVCFSADRRLAPALILAAGFACGPIFPTLIAILLGAFDPMVQGRALGATLAISNPGYVAAPILVGMIAKRTSIQHSFLVVLGSGVALVALSALLVAWT